MIQAIGQISCETCCAVHTGSKLLERKQDKDTGKYREMKKNVYIYWVRGLAPINIAASLPSLIISSLGFKHIKWTIILFFIQPQHIINRMDAKSQPLQGSHHGWDKMRLLPAQTRPLLIALKMALKGSNLCNCNGSNKHESASEALPQKKKQQGTGQEIFVKTLSSQGTTWKRCRQDPRVHLGQDPSACLEGWNPEFKCREGTQEREQKVK